MQENSSSIKNSKIKKDGVENMGERFANNMIIHCPEKQQAELLIGETDVPKRNSREEAIAGWDKYKESTVYGLMWKPSYENPTLVWYGQIDDEAIAERKITEYSDLLN